ncbi:hypothetical protein [Crenalkalicoccus roseus]|uniref:hypothetical protein n=1 Tax=Crenalkalicoccus roseus TaxID=1485588 RepID=UPI0010807F16|nr:hypothetical protein [Crenalkalicoccus roseus]
MHWANHFGRTSFVPANDRTPGGAPSPATLALLARLGEAERHVLAWLPADGSARGGASRDMVHALIRLRDLGLCGRSFGKGGRGARWHATSQGLRVQALLRGDAPGPAAETPSGRRQARGALRRAAQEVLDAWHGVRAAGTRTDPLPRAMARLRDLLGAAARGKADRPQASAGGD